MDLNEDSYLSDEEVFIGKLTLKEVKKHILMDLHQKNLTRHATGDKKVYNADSPKIIQTSSQPNILSTKETQDQRSDVEHLKSSSYPLINRQCDKLTEPIIDLQSEDSFIKIERNVNDHSMTPNKNNLDNTLDLIDFILNHAPSNTEVNKKWVTDEVKLVDDDYQFAYYGNVPGDEIVSQSSGVEKIHENQEKCFISSSSTPAYKKDEQGQFNTSLSSSMDVNAASTFNTAISNKEKALHENELKNFISSSPTPEYIKDEQVQNICTSPSNITVNAAVIINSPMSIEDRVICENQVKNIISSTPTPKCIKDEPVKDNPTLSINMKVTAETTFNAPISNKGKALYENQVKNLISSSSTSEFINSEQVQNNSTPFSNIKVNADTTFNTPIPNKGKFLNVFKTPNIPLSGRKETCLKKTPNRSKAYEHICSPIASYIKRSPQVPLVKDVYPKKPLPNTSLIPRIMKNDSENKMSNKENVVLPPLAYKSAKKTTVINTCIEKCSQNTWSKKLTSSLQKPVVLKHDYRETKIRPLASQQDSFANLSLHQADVSVCTQKYAFNKP